MMDRVSVLISTYNGERYIGEQIQSILNQTHKNIKIYVRDDGSTDATADILKEYEKNGIIEFLEGNNIGFGRSFLKLLEYADESDFWAFCDQDDVWDEHKIEFACKKLNEMSSNTPNLYVHDFFLADESMNNFSKYGNYIPRYDFRMAITECLHMGFSMVFNVKFRELMLRGNIDKLPSHDWWAELIAMEFGNVYVDDYIGAKHRRLDNSISENNLKNRVKWVGRALRGDSEIPFITKEFKSVFQDEMSKESLQVLDLFVESRYSLLKSLKKAVYPRRWRTSLTSEIVVRILMLIGKI